MQIVARQHLTAFLTTAYDPDGINHVEMSAFASKILEHAPAEVAWFLITDHENGDDPEISWGYLYRRHQDEELIPLTYAPNDCGYYGLIAQTNKYIKDSRILYQCYLGGSSGNSAPGFVVACVLVWEPEQS